MATSTRSVIGRTSAFRAQMPPYHTENFVDNTNNTDPIHYSRGNIPIHGINNPNVRPGHAHSGM
ncbi:hypothetical protein KC19_VG015100 [Ceratodon purpureus]|uniref:Uncharacterized protein n=1 Tax=Ceratodon purpureus TaxID=3225 RepID=A0A8T0HL26_CERPU|nr:hypothetical protein KC19_VG015100 [Ceratodon purpureus]